MEDVTISAHVPFILFDEPKLCSLECYSLLNPALCSATQWHALALPATHEEVSPEPLWSAVLKGMLSSATEQNILGDHGYIIDLVCLCWHPKSHSDINKALGE